MDEDQFDPEEDSMPADVLVLGRDVETKDGRVVRLEGHITKQPESEDGVTWIKMHEKGTPENFTHCFVDTIDAELILDAMENYIRAGKGPRLVTFLKEEGRSIRNPVTFRLKLDTALGGEDLKDDVSDLF